MVRCVVWVMPEIRCAGGLQKGSVRCEFHHRGSLPQTRIAAIGLNPTPEPCIPKTGSMIYNSNLFKGMFINCNLYIFLRGPKKSLCFLGARVVPCVEL